MRVRVVPSAPGEDQARQFLTTFVIDDVLAIDAGGLGLWDRQDRHARVRDVFLTHSHLDHVATLPLYIDNVYDSGVAPRVWGSAATLEALRDDLFNDRLWPDLERIGKETGRTFYDLREVGAEVPTEVGPWRVTPVEVNEVIRSAAATRFRSIVEFTDQPIVSSDVIGNSHSAVVDGLSTTVLGGNLLKTVTWYDNGWGYATRVVELVRRLAELEHSASEAA